MGCLSPDPDFLPGVRQLCDEYKSLQIIDAVKCRSDDRFSCRLSSAQAKYQVKPDLTTPGEAIGGGMPVGAVGGRRDMMELLVMIMSRDY